MNVFRLCRSIAELAAGPLLIVAAAIAFGVCCDCIDTNPNVGPENSPECEGGIKGNSTLTVSYNLDGLDSVIDPVSVSVALQRVESSPQKICIREDARVSIPQVNITDRGPGPATSRT